MLQKFLGKKMILVGIKTYKRTIGSNITPEAKSNALKAVKVIEMCMAVPGVVVDAVNKLVKMNEQEKKVKFSIPGLKKGDFVLVHSGVVIEKLSKEEYEDACSPEDSFGE
jgi:hydrogenase maturation factor